MDTDVIAQQIGAVSEAELKDVLEKFLAGQSIEGQLSSVVEPLAAPSMGNGTLGLWRVRGHNEPGSDSVPWSVIVKAIDPCAPVVIAGFNHTWRELEALRSGRLATPKSGLQPVPTYAIHDRPDGTAWVWMKDLSNEQMPPWTSKAFLDSARHIGQFNGSMTGLDSKYGNWVATDGSTDRRISLLDDYSSAVESVARNTHHPGVAEAGSVIGIDRMLSLADDLRILIASTNTAPRSIAHNDCHARNLFPIDAGITFAIDWASVGMAPVGIDGGGLTGASITWSQHEANQIEQIESQVFAQYMLGLRECGWDGDESTIRLSYLSTFASYVLHLVFMLNSFITEGPFAAGQRRRLSVDGDEAYEQIAKRLGQFVPLVDEALELAGEYPARTPTA